MILARAKKIKQINWWKRKHVHNQFTFPFVPVTCMTLRWSSSSTLKKDKKQFEYENVSIEEPFHFTSTCDVVFKMNYNCVRFMEHKHTCNEVLKWVCMLTLAMHCLTVMTKCLYDQRCDIMRCVECTIPQGLNAARSFSWPAAGLVGELALCAPAPVHSHWSVVCSGCKWHPSAGQAKRRRKQHHGTSSKHHTLQIMIHHCT